MSSGPGPVIPSQDPSIKIVHDFDGSTYMLAPPPFLKRNSIMISISQKFQSVLLCLGIWQVATLTVFAQGNSKNQLPLAGTKAWDVPADPAKEMVEGIHKHLDKMLEKSFLTRDKAWDKSISNVAENRARFLRLTKTIGAVEPPARNAEIQRLDRSHLKENPVQVLLHSRQKFEWIKSAGLFLKIHGWKA